MRLFCLPYAGGSQFVYCDWKKHLNSLIELDPIELKGRGKKINEVFYKTLEEAVEDIFEDIKDKIQNDDYAIYGHSMGGLLAYELYYKITSEKLKKPRHIFFSGYKPPSVKNREKKIYLLPDNEFMRHVIELGGTPEELINNRDLFELFVPILRNDFKILEEYIYREKTVKIQCDISILNGNQDDIKVEEIIKWKEHGGKGVKIYNFEGNHFFINNNVKNITDIINETLIK